MLRRFTAKLGWPLLLLLCIIPIILWLFIMPFNERVGNTYAVLTSLGRLTGLLAVIFYCFNLILTTRFQFIEDLFGGLNKTFIAHHLIGGFALLFALLHSTALTLRLTSTSISDAANLALPFTTNWATTYGVLSLWFFIALMVVTFYIALPYRLWLISHKFLGGVFLLLALHVVLIPSDITDATALKWYLYILIGLASISFIYRTLLPRFFSRRYKYIVTKVEPVVKGSVRITMQPQTRRLDFKSGQFVFASFHIMGLSKEWHPFSISSNTQAEGICITIKSLGKYTDDLTKLGINLINSEVILEGAYGRFSFKNFNAKHQIWIAGGIGITPFLSMLPEVRPDYKIDLYYSVKSETELMDIQIMRQWLTDSKGALNIIPVVSARDGQLTAEKIIAQSGDLSDAELLLCGPPAMMQALRKQLRKQGLKNHKIHSEEFALT